jgi:multidrug resistance efflux pump
VLGMDVRREPRPKRRYALMGVTLGIVLVVAVGVSRLVRTTPSVSADSLIFGTVQRGDLVLEVRAVGILVPAHARIVAVVAQGRVEAVLVKPGAQVVAGDVIVELSNPGIELEVLEAERQWTAAQAELLSLSRGLGMEQLDLESSVASLQVEHDEVRRLALVASQLALDSLVTVHDSKTASDREQAVATRLQAQRARLDLLSDTSPREIALLRDQVERLQAICRYHVERRNSLRIQAGADGVVQSLDLQIGQWVQSGTTVAIVARTDELTAELKIPQGQAADVRPGQRVMIEARPDSIRGRIRRVDPAVAEGHVLVEVELTDALPSAARPNLNVLGTIQLERLPDRLLVDRPAYGSRNGRCQAFRCTNDRRGAELVTVTFGRGSFNQIEVVDGLEQGDVLILSDMSKYDGAARLVIR